ncbi:unnamed protein product [Callosobruchus maculatus]|uniref:Uncharacterized protein n=1 Tax=Callosobruchus maculatus TaxID=64391 RepID=A0A653D3F6_CALMS|nr:unnamed protein product [Callosobruchus maculatus]
MATYAAYRHIELDKVGYSKKREHDNHRAIKSVGRCEVCTQLTISSAAQKTMVLRSERSGPAVPGNGKL